MKPQDRAVALPAAGVLFALLGTAFSHSTAARVAWLIVCVIFIGILVRTLLRRRRGEGPAGRQ